MIDLTKILKVGDLIWDTRYGTVKVLQINDHPYPVTVTSEAGILSYTKEGRPTALCEVTLYPLNQKPAPPKWPTERELKEQVLFDYLEEEAKWTPSSTQLSEIFRLIEKK